jgi:GT2 family glycosyltransferase
MIRPLRLAAHAWRVLMRRRTYLPPLVDFARQVGVAPPDAVRDLGPVPVGGVTRRTTFCHPDVSLSHELSEPARGFVTVWAALLPDVWTKNSGGVVFEVSARRAKSGRQRSRSLHLRPSGRTRDRRWRRLQVRMPAAASGSDGTVVMTLSTRIPDGESSAWAWAVWADPELVTRRPAADVSATLKTWWQRARAVGIGAMVRQSLPRPPAGDEYGDWRIKHDPTPADLARMRIGVDQWPDRPLISVLTPTYNTPPEWLSACAESVRRQVYDRWEWCLADDGSTEPATCKTLEEIARDTRVKLERLPANGGISRASNAALSQASGEIVVLLDHDDELAPHALYEVAAAFRQRPETVALYSDEDKIEHDGTHSDPYFKPDWSPDHFMGTMYVCHLSAIRREAMIRVGGFREGYEGAQDYDLWLRVAELSENILHVPNILYHWRKVAGSAAASPVAKPWAIDAGRRAIEDTIKRRQLAATVETGPAPGNYRVRFAIAGDSTVSMLVPTPGVEGPSSERVSQCLRSLLATTCRRPVNLVLATETGALPEPVRRALSGEMARITIVRSPNPFNFSSAINIAARRASGRFLLIGNDDVEAISEDWLDALLEYAQQERIGAVGPRLDFPDGRIQHVGLILGVHGAAAHAFHGAHRESQGYFGSIIGPRNYSAVSGACLLTRAELFNDLAGFDEMFELDFNDVDYCLRLRSRGYRIVYTPYARLRHHQGATSGTRHPSARAIALMRGRWLRQIESDPYFNVHWSRDFADYRLA